MNPEYLAQHYDLKRVKTNVSYNGTKLRITDIKRKDGEMMSRKQMIKMCDGFLAELREKYPAVDGLVSVSIKYPDRWYSADVSDFKSAINYFHMSLKLISIFSVVANSTSLFIWFPSTTSLMRSASTFFLSSSSM